MKTLHHDTFDSPIGKVLIAIDGNKLCALEFEDFEDRMQTLLGRHYGAYELVRGRDRSGIAERIRNCLDAYFAGDLRALDTIEVATGGTAFQQRCWQALRTIAPGATASYAEQARRIGNPKAVRAVGTTNGRNPVAIVLPCHRVIGADGTLTGYAGGLWRKEWLLRHEGALQ
jgi:methylated-DNA-[protein]-cysteine S-methyltransferase